MPVPYQLIGYYWAETGKIYPLDEQSVDRDTLAEKGLEFERIYAGNGEEETTV